MAFCLVRAKPLTEQMFTLISQFYFVISDKAFHNIIQVTHKRQQCVSGTALYIKSCETVAEDKR